jgi:hypothetical protein
VLVIEVFRDVESGVGFSEFVIVIQSNILFDFGYGSGKHHYATFVCVLLI